MGRIGVTYQDIVKIIPKLQAQGKSITVDNARAELNTGSKSTIARLLREWKAAQGLSVEDDGSLPTELLSMVKELWLRLQSKADAAIDKHQQECDGVLKKMEQQLNQYKAKDTEWQGRVHTLEEKVHQQSEDNKRLNAEVIAEQQEKIKAREHVEALQARQQENEAEKERLHELLKHVQANLEHYQTATQQLRLEQEIIVEKQRADYEQRLSQLQDRIEIMAREKTFLEARCAGLDKDCKIALAREAALVEEAENLRQKYTILEANYGRLQQDWEEVSHESSVQRQALEAKERVLVEYQFKLKMTEDNLSSLQKTLSTAEDKIVALRDDYSFVVQEKANLEGQVRQLREMFAN